MTLDQLIYFHEGCMQEAEDTMAYLEHPESIAQWERRIEAYRETIEQLARLQELEQ